MARYWLAVPAHVETENQDLFAHTKVHLHLPIDWSAVSLRKALKKAIIGETLFNFKPASSISRFERLLEAVIKSGNLDFIKQYLDRMLNALDKATRSGQIVAVILVWRIMLGLLLV